MGLFDFIADAVDLVKDMVTTPEPKYSAGDMVYIDPLDRDMDIYDELSKRDLTAHQKSLYWEVMEDDGIYVTMHQVGYKGTKVKVPNYYLTKVQQQSSPIISDDKNKKSSQSESSSFNYGDKVKFKSTANVYYDYKSGAKVNIPSTLRDVEWYVDQIDAYNNKFVFLTSEFGRIKVRVSDLTISDSVNQSSNVNENTKKQPQSSQAQTCTSTEFEVGDFVKFNSKASTYYNAKSGAKIPLSSKEKSTVWKITQFDISSNKIVHLMSLSDNNIKIKAQTSDLVISYYVNQPTNSIKQSTVNTKKQTGKEKNMVHNNNYNGYQFTALGLSGSGKTCFMAGMYYKMTGGVSGYTLKADDDDSVNLTAYYEQMTNAEIGADRFPGGTNQSTDYSFELQYGYKTLEKFRWVDYAGGTLKNKNNGDAEEYQQLKNDIAKSEVLYIFVDGGLFIDEDVEDASSDSEKIEILTDIVMDSCSRQINHFIAEYTSERKKLPPIAIIVTKYDLAVKALGKADNSENMEMLYKVIQRAFNPLFPDPSMYTGDEGHTSMVGIIPVSLGSKISEGNYTGKLRPINMHMPAYIGIWFMLKSKKNQETSVKKLSDEIEDSGIKFWLDGKTGKFSTLAEGYLKKVKEDK